MPLAAKYNAAIIALTLAATGLPTTADARIQLASECIFPACERYGLPMEDLYLDPLVLTVNGNQDQAQATIEAVRFFRQMTDPPPKTVCGLSNISNGAPNELRPLINRAFLLMMMGAGLDSAIMDTLDAETMEALRVVEARDTSTLRGRLHLAIYDAYCRGESFDPSGFDPQDPQARVNLGIRRRLAPLMGNNRRKMELLNSLLFSLPGTPVKPPKSFTLPEGGQK